MNMPMNCILIKILNCFYIYYDRIPEMIYLMSFFTQKLKKIPWSTKCIGIR